MGLSDILPFGDSGDTDVEEGERRREQRYDTSPAQGTTDEYAIRNEEIRDIDSLDLDAWTDSQKRGLIEQIRTNRRILGLVSIFGIAFLVMVAIWISPLLPDFTDPRTYLPVAVPAVIIGLYLAGRRALRAKLSNLTVVATYLKDGAGVFVCEPVSGSNNEFIVTRGFSPYGFRRSRLEVRDLSRKMSRLVGSQSDANDPVKLRLKPSHTRRVIDTFLGDVIITRGTSIKATPSAEAKITLSRPETVDEEEYNNLKEITRTQSDKLDSFAERIRTLTTQRNRAERQARKRREEIREEIIDTHSELSRAGRDPVVPREAREYGYLDEGGDDSE